MATKFSDFTAQAATGTTFVVGYDGTTNTRYTRTQTTDFVFGGTLGQTNTLTLGGYQINLSQGGSGNFLYMNGTSANAYFLQGRYNGQAKASLGLNTGSGRLELWHAGTTKYIDLNPKDYVNYLLANTSIGTNSGTPPAKLHVKGQGSTSATTSLIVENSNGDKILNIRDDQYVTITGNNTIPNFFILKNDATWTMLDAGDAGSNNGQLRIKSSNNNRFWFRANSGLSIADAGAVTLDSSAVLKADSTTKGLLPPRMTNTQRDAISSPTAGLMLYSSTDSKLQFYNGSAWQDAAGGDSIYTANGTIGASRVATITDFPKFSGTQSNPIGLEIENTQTSASAHSTQGAQLKLTARAGASSTISFYNGLGGGSSAPAMVIDSPTGIQYKAGATYSNYYHTFRGSTWSIGMANSPIYSSSPKLEMLLGGGGGNGSFYTTKINGSSDFLYMFMSPGTAARHIALGEYTNSTTTYKDFLRINSTGDIGINQDTPTAKLHVTGSGSTNATTALVVENSTGNDILNIKDDGTFTLGISATANGSSNVTIGSAASGSSVYGVAIGRLASIGSQASYSTVIGNQAATTFAQNVAIGGYSGVGFKGTSVGYGASGTGNYAINLGHDADGSAARSVTINASSGTAAPSKEFEFGVYMTGATTPDFRVIGAEGMVPPSITTTVRDAISSPISGSTIYNTTTNKLQFYNGSSWTDAGGGGDSIYTADGTLSGNRNVNLGTNNLGFTNGKVGVGLASPLYTFETRATVAGNWVSRIMNESNTGYGLLVRVDNSSSNITFATHNGAGYTTAFHGTGEVGIGTATSTPSARLHVKGSGNTNSTTAFLVENSVGNDILNIKGDGAFTLGKSASITSSTPNSNVVLGTSALCTSNDSVVIGKSATTGSGGNHNVLIGADTSVANNTSFGIAIGRYASSNSNGIAIGYSSAVGGNGIAIGRDAEATANPSITINASGSTAQNTTANSFAVHMSDASTPDFRIVHDGNSYITGTGNFGFGDGNTSPTATVDIDGTFRLRSSSNVNGRVLKADANGNGTWIRAKDLDFSGLPTSDPGVEGLLWNDEGTVKVSIP